MKVKEKDIQIVKSDVINSVGSYVQSVVICKTQVYLYYKSVPAEALYKVYNISENTYKGVLRGTDIREDREECIGSMTAGDDEKTFLCQLQNSSKVFGNVAKKPGGKARLVLGLITLLGLLSAGIGLYKIQYNKQLLAREAVVEGKISSYSTARLKGSHYANGYYDVRVWYVVDGQKYEGYNGKTANQPKEGAPMMVHYDSKNPGTIIIEDEMNEYTFYFLYIGAIVFVVGLALFISELKPSKR